MKNLDVCRKESDLPKVLCKGLFLLAFSIVLQGCDLKKTDNDYEPVFEKSYVQEDQKNLIYDQNDDDRNRLEKLDYFINFLTKVDSLSDLTLKIEDIKNDLKRVLDNQRESLNNSSYTYKKWEEDRADIHDKFFELEKIIEDGEVTSAVKDQILAEVEKFNVEIDFIEAYFDNVWNGKVGKERTQKFSEEYKKLEEYRNEYEKLKEGVADLSVEEAARITEEEIFPLVDDLMRAREKHEEFRREDLTGSPEKAEIPEDLLNSKESFIFVDLKTQTLFFFERGDNGKTVFSLETPITSGKNSTPSPVGDFQVLGFRKNHTMPGGFFSEKIVIVTRQGHYIHDARWRDPEKGYLGFGGSNRSWNGSHGCINTPKPFVYEIYERTYALFQDGKIIVIRIK